MSNSPKKLSENQVHQCCLGVPTDVLISLGTVPLMITLLGAKITTTVIKEIGHQSEELLRGVRLPILNFPSPGSLELGKEKGNRESI